MAFHQNTSSRGLKIAASNYMKGIDHDVLWEDDHEENPCSSDESFDSDYSDSVVCLQLFIQYNSYHQRYIV
jgi:hypothetical protein